MKNDSNQVAQSPGAKPQTVARIRLQQFRCKKFTQNISCNGGRWAKDPFVQVRTWCRRGDQSTLRLAAESMARAVKMTRLRLASGGIPNRPGSVSTKGGKDVG
jgi:hypothetical protein